METDTLAAERDALRRLADAFAGPLLRDAKAHLEALDSIVAQLRAAGFTVEVKHPFGAGSRAAFSATRILPSLEVMVEP
jgi:hypothetical protein